MEAPNLTDLVKLDDPALIAWRQETRAGLKGNPDEVLQAIYDATTGKTPSAPAGSPSGGNAT